MWTRWVFALVVYTLFAAALAQYADQAFSALGTRSIDVWNMSTAGMNEAGAVRYVKDVLTVVIGVGWPIALARGRFPYDMSKFVLLYFVWLFCVISIGLVPFILGWTPLFFLAAGMRWVLLLHASFGLFLFGRWLPDGVRGQTAFVIALLALAALDFYVVLRQWMDLGQGRVVSFAGDRYTGLLSNATLAGMYAISLACMTLILDRARLLFRLLLIGLAVGIAVSSGTRFAMLCVAPVTGLLFWEVLAGRLDRRARMLLVMSALPIAASLVTSGYAHMVDAVGRGDVLDNQIAEGGRLYNLVQIADQLSQANVPELLIGRGLGVGTNTAYSMVQQAGAEPEQYRFNLLIDNAFVTMQFQLGTIGTLLFVTGAAAFLWRLRPRHSGYLRARHLVFVGITLGACMDINLLEQYPLVTTLFVCFGDTYWRAVHKTGVRLQAAPGRARPKVGVDEAPFLNM